MAKTTRIAVLPLLCLCAVLAQGAQAPDYSLTRITGDLYRGSTGAWHNLVYVTPEGILLVDTLNVPFAEWLKGELDRRFPGVPVRYVVYTHSHWDHVEGGRAFEDTAVFVAHEGMRRNMDGRYPHMPGDMVDRNGNGSFEPEEFRIPWDAAPGVCGAFYLQRLDLDGDGSLTPAEYFAEIRPPDLVYRDRLRIVLGGRGVEVIHPGRNHADDTSVVLFHAERTLFSADFLADALTGDTMHSLPSACGPFDGHPLQEWIDSYRAVEALDFDILTTAHGVPLRFGREEVTATREYFEFLRDEVRTALEAGLGVDEMKEKILLEPYRDWDQYDNLRARNVEAAYENLTMDRPGE